MAKKETPELLVELEQQVVSLLAQFADVNVEDGKTPIFDVDMKLKVLDRGIKIAALQLKLEEDEGGSEFRRPFPSPPFKQPTGSTEQ